MNPETSLSNDQIKAIFAKYKLATDPKIRRITIGFTNEIHQVDEYILKVYLRPTTGEESFDKESGFYKNLHGKVLVPELVVADKSLELLDKPFIIYKMIEGEPLGSCWHKLTDSQRKQIIEDVCVQIKLIQRSDTNPQLNSGQTWQEQMIATIQTDLKVAKDNQLLSRDIITQIEDYLPRSAGVLEQQTLGLMYWDVHLDNLIVNEQSKLVGIIDFEHVDVVSIDFVLTIIRQMVRYPHLMLAEDMEQYANKADYQYVMDWFKEFYPELFEFPKLERRIDLYELADLLRLLPRFPKAQQLHDRLNLILK
jgi:aminoglycoside phosphotransferase (APT) family kinase protein